MRWSDPATIHLTLRFLGEIPGERVPAVAQAVAGAAAGGRPLELVVTGAGGFPSPRRPRVLWLGVGGEVAALRVLAADLEARLAAMGLAPEGRPLSPHLTIGRTRSPRGAPALGPALSSTPGPPLPWRADALLLFESHLDPGGASHVALLRAPLRGVEP